MGLLALAVPFFLLALVLEVVLDCIRGTRYFRINDALNSLSVGTLSTTTGYFTAFFGAAIWAYVLQHFSLISIELDYFDASLRGIVNWTIALLAFDFFYYWRHRFGHEISILWAAHAVHHQSEDYNLSTALRQSSSGFLFSWIFYLPLFVCGMPYEVFVTVYASDLIYQFWVHTRHIKSLGWLDRVIVTPSNHRVHHAQNEVYIDKNYGGILIVWDRLFGTFQEELATQPVVFGVRKPLQSWNPIWANLQVYDYLLHDAIRTNRWRDKLAIWFKKTGWRPADVAEKYAKPVSSLDKFAKYSPPISKGNKAYAVVQFSLLVPLIFWIGERYTVHGVRGVVLPCLVLWFSLWSIGAITENRRHAFRSEVARLLLVVPVVAIYLYAADPTVLPVSTIAAITACFIGFSLWFVTSLNRYKTT